MIRILGQPVLDIPSREWSRKILTQLKALADTMNNLERNTNFLLRQVLNGKDARKVTVNETGPPTDPRAETPQAAASKREPPQTPVAQLDRAADF